MSSWEVWLPSGKETLPCLRLGRGGGTHDFSHLSEDNDAEQRPQVVPTVHARTVIPS